MKSKIVCPVCHKEIYALGIASHNRLHTSRKGLSLGDVVMLKSGGPKMTLFTITEIGNYWCRYYENEKWKEAAFYKHELKKV